MSNTLWILEENQSKDTWDHSVIVDEIKYLDSLCRELNFSKLSTYFDESILAEEFGMDIKPKYFDAHIVEEIVSSLLQKIKGSTKLELIDELKDILKKSISAKEKNLKVRLALVP
jgi:hypothetical protein